MNTVKELPNGLFDVQDETGKSLLDRFGGPCHSREFAETIQRLLTGFDATDERIKQINGSLRARVAAERIVDQLDLRARFSNAISGYPSRDQLIDRVTGIIEAAN